MPRFLKVGTVGTKTGISRGMAGFKPKSPLWEGYHHMDILWDNTFFHLTHSQLSCAVH